MKDRELFEQGNAFLENKQYAEAKAYYEKAIEINPLEAAYYGSLGGTYGYLKQKENNDSYISIGLDNLKAAFLLAPDLLWLKASIDRCISSYYIPLYERFIKNQKSYMRDYKDPKNLFDGYSSLGNYYIALERYNEAVESLETAFRSWPESDNIYSHINMGIAYAGVKKFKEAKDYFAKALKLKAYDESSTQIWHAKAHYQRGLIYHNEGNSEAAVADFEQALQQKKIFGAYEHVQMLLALQKDKAALQQKVDQSNKIIAECKSAYLKEDYALSIRCGEEAIKVFAKTEAAYLYLALAHFKSNNLSVALDYLQQYLPIAQQNNASEHLQKLAQTIIVKHEQKQQSLEQYKADLVKAVKTFPQDVLTQAIEAVCSKGWLEPSKAERLIRVIQERLAVKLQSLPEGASVEDRNTLVSEISKIIQAYLEHQPTAKSGRGALHIHVKIKESDILKNQDLKSKLDNALESALGLMNANINKRSGKIDIFEDHDRAIGIAFRELDEAIKGNIIDKRIESPKITTSTQPKTFDQLLNEAYTLATQQKYSEAIDYYNQAIAVNPNSAYAWIGKAFSLNYGMKNSTDALACYDKAIALDANYEDAWKGKQSILENLNRYPDAIACLNNLIKIAPQNYDYYEQRGALKLQINQKEEAMLDFKRALELMGQSLNADAPGKLIELNKKLKQIEEAQQTELKEARRKQEEMELQRYRAQEQTKQNQQKQELISALHALKLEKPGLSMSSLNQKYQELEPLAQQLQSVDFYIQRGHFYFSSAEKEGSAIRKPVLLQKALADYQQAMILDPFADLIAERIEQIQATLKTSTVSSAITPVVSPTSSTSFYANISAPKPEISPEQRQQIEAMKQSLRQQSTNPSLH